MPPVISAKTPDKAALVPAIIGAVVSLFFIRSGLAVLFFLLPLGFIGYGWGPKTLWPGLFFANLGNCILAFLTGIALRASGIDIFWDVFYFCVTTVAFAWIILPFDEKSSRIPGAYRLAIGSFVCAFVFLGLFQRAFDNPSFFESIQGQVELIASLYGLGGAGTQSALFDPAAVEKIIELIRVVILRGGALFTSVLMFFFNRQFSAFLIRLFGGPRRDNAFVKFHVYPSIMWALLFSFLLIMAANMFGWTAPGIFFWNTLVLCVLMYLAQGYGIIRFFMAKPGFPQWLRFLLPVVFIILLLNPVINTVILALVFCLGIAEYWVSFRNAKINGPSSTPGI